MESLLEMRIAEEENRVIELINEAVDIAVRSHGFFSRFAAVRKQKAYGNIDLLTKVLVYKPRNLFQFLRENPEYATIECELKVVGTDKKVGTVFNVTAVYVHAPPRLEGLPSELDRQIMDAVESSLLDLGYTRANTEVSKTYRREIK